MDRFMEEKWPLPVVVAPPPTHRIEVDGEIDLDRLEMFGGRVHPHHIPEVVWSIAESNTPPRRGMSQLTDPFYTSANYPIDTKRR